VRNRRPRGSVLVITLSLLALITAMVVEFSYSVYISAHHFRTWQAGQRLSLVAESGVRLSAASVYQNHREIPFTYPASSEIGYDDLFKEFKLPVSLHIRIEDENSKFNLNTLGSSDELGRERAFQALVRLLGGLGLDPAIADRIADWIDEDQNPRRPGSEKGAKNKRLDSTDEILSIPGVDPSGAKKLMAYTTVYGNGLINLNGASVPVLMSLSPEIDPGIAERIVSARGAKPFERVEDLREVPGLEGLGLEWLRLATVKGSAFRVVSTAQEGEVSRIVECILDLSRGRPVVKYWKEL